MSRLFVVPVLYPIMPFLVLLSSISYSISGFFHNISTCFPFSFYLGCLLAHGLLGKKIAIHIKIITDQSSCVCVTYIQVK